ncbi:MAG TPA: Gfo/Idh/MocA family oxidoreductase [Patescibacteria group bacterium]|nr:Gfo/Idh/MocA family oxidoreductase [Patescibacteria group bacterium]
MTEIDDSRTLGCMKVTRKPMNSSKRINHLRAGIIGTGFIGPVHIEALRRLGVPVVALCDLPDRVEAAAAKHGIPLTFSDYKQMLRSSEVDVVHITVPNRFHCEMALAALRAGKHCVCEKPLAMNTRETARIVSEAAKARTVFAVNYNIRFYPAVLQLRKLVSQGVLGDIIHVNGSYMQDWLFKETDYNWRLLPKEGGKLRAVADIGTHWMDAASFILGAEIESVFADLATWHKTRRRPLGEVETFAKADANIRYASYNVKTEDCASVLLRFSNGARGNLGVSQVAAGRKNCIRIEIYGSRKSAWWCSEQPETLSLGNRDQPNEVSFRGTPNFGPAIAPYIDYPAGHVEGFPDSFKMLFRCVYGRICGIGEERLFAGPRDGHQEVAVCEAISESNRARAWVRVKSPKS